MKSVALVALLAAAAHANGRIAATSSISFRQGHEQDVVAGTTFGMIISRDGGASWRWMCEKAIGYGGNYDPVYAYVQTGSIFATTFDGLKVSQDTCGFAATPPGNTFVSTVALGPDHAMYYAAADPADTKIYKSTDDGMTFPQSAVLGASDWWTSIAISRTDPRSLVISGYRFRHVCGSGSVNHGLPCVKNRDCFDESTQSIPPPPAVACEAHRELLVYNSADGGASFEWMSTIGITALENDVIDAVGIDAAGIAYVRVQDVQFKHSTIYKRTGQTWTPILSQQDMLSFVVRKNGDLVAAAQRLGAWKSSDGGTTWQPLPNPPHVNCLVENEAGEVWGCTQNVGQSMPVMVPSDGFGIMKTTDLVTWTGVLHFQDIAGPIMCDPGTTQYEQCIAPTEMQSGTSSAWCCLHDQIGIHSSEVDCGKLGWACYYVPPDVSSRPPGGCCDAGGAPPTAAVILVILVISRRRRYDRRQ